MVSLPSIWALQMVASGDFIMAVGRTSSEAVSNAAGVFDCAGSEFVVLEDSAIETLCAEYGGAAALTTELWI